METYERRNHKLAKMITMSIMGLSFVLMIVFIVLYINDNNRKPLIKYPTYELSTKEWINGNVTIRMTSDKNKVKAYSFDGGKNFQESNEYEVLDTFNRLFNRLEILAIIEIFCSLISLIS